MSNFRLESVSINILWGWFYCIVFKMFPLIKLVFEINIFKNRYVMMVLVFIFFGTSSFAFDVLEFSSKLPGRLQMRNLKMSTFTNHLSCWFLDRMDNLGGMFSQTNSYCSTIIHFHTRKNMWMHQLHYLLQDCSKDQQVHRTFYRCPLKRMWPYLIKDCSVDYISYSLTVGCS